MTDSETTLLEEINADIPEGIDWKLGAIEYLHTLVHGEGSHNELYHLIKPYLGGPDFQPFFSEMYGFLNMLEKANLPMKASIVDVACGPGWTAHFLAKLGHSVYGVDISEDLLDIARRRIADEPYGVYEGIPLQSRFAVHDIEGTALPSDGPYGPYDAALFESALHHFANPVRALRNVATSLKDAGILCIREGAAPRRGTAPYLQNIEFMRKYRTLERPYTREQMVRMLALTGFGHFEFFAQVNGFFNVADAGDRRKLEGQFRTAKDWNIVIASRRADFFVANGRRAALVNDGSAAGPDSMPVVPGERGEWRGRELLKENVRYLKRRLSGFANARQRSRQEQLERTVRRSYMSILGREPDETGLAHYVEDLKHGKSVADIEQALMASDEYRIRVRSKAS
jgi:SAM-dependent methyltransferase